MKLLSYHLFLEDLKIKKMPKHIDKEDYAGTMTNIYYQIFGDTETTSTKKLKKILKKVCNDLGYYDGTLKYLGSGSYGIAFGIEDKVIKITTDSREASEAKKMTKMLTKHLVNYYSVNSLKVEDNYLYIIVLDKVKTLSQKEDDIIDGIIENINSKRKLNSIKGDTKIIKSLLIPKEKSKYDKLYNQVIQINLELLKYNILESDLHTGNIGWLNKKLVHYDINNFDMYNDTSNLDKIKDIKI